MSKNYFLYTPLICAGLILAAGSATAGAKHLVLHEKFTNTGCGPCARFAPASDSLLNLRLGEVIPITYHGNYPDKYDIFYLANQSSIDARIKQYGINSYPSVIVNGTMVRSSVPAINDKIDEMLGDEQTIDLRLDTKFENGILHAKMTATPLKHLNNPDLRMFVCTVEDVVTLSHPASNGQSDFHYEVRQFLQEPEGYNGGTFSDLTPVVFEKDCEVTGFDDITKMSVVGWIQNVKTGEVLECVYSPRSTDKPNNAKVLLVQDTPDAICAPFYNAKVTFRNTGYEKLTSCNICVSINGSVQKTPWQGELEYLEKVTVTTPDFTEFDLDPDSKTNACKVFISDINGSDAQSDPVSVNFKNSVSGERAIEVSVFTDNKPEETAWELTDAAGNVLEVSEPFTEKRKFHKHIFNLSSDGCYRVHFTDKGGDGIIGNYGNGYYKLSQITAEGKTKMITQGEFAGAEHSVFFRLDNAVSGIDNVETTGFMIYNAANRTVEVNSPDATINIVDASGRIVLTVNGANPIADCSALSAGVYVISAVSADEAESMTIIL